MGFRALGRAPKTTDDFRERCSIARQLHGERAHAATDADDDRGLIGFSKTNRSACGRDHASAVRVSLRRGRTGGVDDEDRHVRDAGGCRSVHAIATARGGRERKALRGRVGLLISAPCACRRFLFRRRRACFDDRSDVARGRAGGLHAIRTSRRGISCRIHANSGLFRAEIERRWHLRHRNAGREKSGGGLARKRGRCACR